MIPTEMVIPKLLRALIAAITITSFVFLFIVLAIVNLFNQIAIIPSALGLLLIIVFLSTGCRCDGTKRMLVNMLGGFSLREFIQIVPQNGKCPEIRFGYRFFGHRFYYVRAPLDCISEVVWSTGQVSYQAQRDMNDWSVVVWFEGADSKWFSKPPGKSGSDRDLIIVGFSGPRSRIEKFGMEIVEFLRQAGAALVEKENGQGFVRLRGTDRA